MNKWVEILIGLILLDGAIIAAWFSSANSWTVFGRSLNFLHAGWLFLQGGVFWLVLLAGLLFIILGISDMRE